MTKHSLLGSIITATVVAALGACSNEGSTPSEPSSPTLEQAAVTQAALSGSIRLRCERRSGRSKISVDGRNLTPRTGRYRAQVSAAGGTVTSPLQRAVSGEAEFDFDSDRGDIREGATRIAANFIRARAGADVVARILNADGKVVATRSGECEAR